VAGAGFEPA